MERGVDDRTPAPDQQLVLSGAYRAGDQSSGRVRVLIRWVLIEAAKWSARLSARSKLGKSALGRLATADVFGVRLLARKGSVSPDVDLGL